MNLCGAHRSETKITEDFPKVDDLLSTLTGSEASEVESETQSCLRDFHDTAPPLSIMEGR